MVYTVELKHVLITVRDWMLIPVILSISLLDPAKDPYLGLSCWAECASTSCVGRSCDFLHMGLAMLLGCSSVSWLLILGKGEEEEDAQSWTIAESLLTCHR